MADETMPSWVLDALTDRARQKLVLSWQRTRDRGVVVIGADMEETELKTEHDARLFLAGISSALTAFHDGEAEQVAEINGEAAPPSGMQDPAPVVRVIEKGSKETP